MKTIQLLFISLLFFNITVAQVVPPQDDSKIEEKVENIANTADESADLTELTEQLQQLAANPINLNKATREDLLQTGLFSEVQADAIIEHREISGKFISLYELQSIDFLSLEDIEEILPYVTVGNTEDIKTTFKKYLLMATAGLLFVVNVISKNKKDFATALHQTRFILPIPEAHGNYIHNISIATSKDLVLT